MKNKQVYKLRASLKLLDGDGNLNAVRIGEWKVIFTEMSGNLPTAWHKTPSWPLIVNLRRDPYERFDSQSEMYMKWWAERMFVMEPAKAAVGAHLQSLKDFPPARGSSLSLGKIFEKIQYASPGQ